MKELNNLSGRTFGRWTVLDYFILTAKGEKKWKCRCTCGTERFVLERSLKSGGSLSCGCLRKEAAQKAVAYDLAGSVFGELTVLRKSDRKRSYGGVWWLCQCTCGKLCDASATMLINGKQTHCGKEHHGKNYAFADVTGKRFHRLTALYPTTKRDEKGSVIWHCACDCGNEIDVSYNSLMYSELKSCGCQKKEHDQNLHTYLTHIDGTSLDAIRSKKVPSDNTTGYRGVYLIKGKYAAKIVFQKKAYYLGTFENMADAVRARQDAEKQLFDDTAAFYEKWKEQALHDPAWAKENPIQIQVKKDRMHGLKVVYSPAVDL